ncbi:MAG: AAA family ATPase, partial [Proteobacteria bacterium]|nr:AAA family ATPase [Pseudomonadota bacterium]
MAHLTLRGAQTHNLKQIDLDLPLGTWIALTGLSGSGKTTLAFDVLHREGQRRYLGALSAKARHYLGKLGAADLETLTGLPVTLATGQGALTPSPRSTVGTLTGLLDLLRLLYARDGVHPTATDLSRSDFSFNQDRGACAACKGLGIEDLVDPLLLVADGSRSLRDGALRPTLANGYTVYSQVTLEVMNTICAAHGFDVDTPWQQLSDAQRDVIFYGTKALTVPFGKHSIASRMKWEGITARPREEGFYRGLIPVIEETLKRDRNPNILRFVRSVDCSVCDGTRLGPIGRETTVGPWTLPELLAKPATALSATLDQLPASAVLDALRPAVDRRLRRMGQLSLGHLALNRISTTLSGGEGQRLRLAAQLNAQLGGMLVILDEPTLGLHPSAQQGMAEILEELRALGNTLLVVDHDPHMVQRADHWLALGPGAGPHGGEVTHAGPMPDKALQHGLSKPVDREHVGQIRLSGASLHNLDGVELSVPLSALTVLSGPSGAGKSSLVFGTLLPALQGKPGGPYVALHGVPDSLSVQWVDAKPIGRTPRSTPATYTGLFDLVRKRFAATPAAKSRGFKASHFSYNAKAGRCPVCEGLGLQRVGLHLLQDVEVPCPACAGQRYAAEVLQVELRGQHIGAVLDLTVDEAEAFFADDPPIHAICVALSQLGLGYLHLGQASSTLSRGEAQRVRLATLLGKPPRSASVVLLDEPDRGLHPDDVARLLTCLGQLVEAGHTVLAVSHHPMVWSAADHRVALRDGRLASPDAVPSHPPRAERPPAHLPKQITLRGVRTHNLANLDVCIPHGQITAITGVSGSGKTSLAYDTLAAAAWSRFAESLPFQVRRFMRQLPAPNLDSAEGLTPVLALKQGQGRAGPRATVGTLSEIDAGLRLLWSRLGVDEGQPTGLSASHFSPNQTMGACPSCAGRGSVLRCDPERLVTQPERALDEGAMEGTKPGAFFGEPDGQYMQTLRAAAKSAGLDVDVPYADLTPAARQLALFGAGEAVFDVEWNYRRGKRTGSHSFKGPWLGLNALVEHEAKVRAKRKNAAEWAVPLAPSPCNECDGERLSEEARRVTVGPLRLPQASALELEALDRALSDLQLPQAQTAVVEAIRPGLQAKLSTLIELGLGHLTLARPS